MESRSGRDDILTLFCWLWIKFYYPLISVSQSPIKISEIFLGRDNAASVIAFSVDKPVTLPAENYAIIRFVCAAL
jgi:hypothetical protein